MRAHLGPEHRLPNLHPHCQLAHRLLQAGRRVVDLQDREGSVSIHSCSRARPSKTLAFFKHLLSKIRLDELDIAMANGVAPFVPGKFNNLASVAAIVDIREMLWIVGEVRR